MTTQDQAQAPGATGTTTEDEALDLGNDDLPSTGTSEAPAPAPAPAATPAPANDASSGEGTGGTQNVPYARFREVNENKRLLEEQLAAVQQELQAIKAGQQPAAAPSPAAAPAPAAFDVDAAEEQYAQALLDGDAKAASAIRREINQHIETSVMKRVAESSQQEQVLAKSEVVVANAMETYPWLDQEDGTVALELIEASVRAKVADGVPHHIALANAIATIAPRFAPDDTPSRVLPNGGAPADTRMERANKRGAADSLLQPAAVQAGMGNRATAPKIDGSTKLSDDQIDGLPKADLDKALGIG
ncbi:MULTISPECIES: hypothetical protein [unclassified Acidovorax]|uniref:hypothetical protein n=1 Tax=unclassified Acidovorax TaxID=2684926 RepID=UPI001C4554EE|nr:MULTISPECIES: hypothetical protein [unclassified Acidovorax]MBV7460614.1 hypothetical protein [Acidovorax sp. sif0632]MBV7465639.1 hypothetical protein [Acidovorax sp. sif0613]